MIFDGGNTNVITILVLIGVFGALCLVAFIIHRITHPKLKSDDKPTEEQILKEEMDRYVKPIEDDEVAKQVSEYKEKDDKS